MFSIQKKSTILLAALTCISCFSCANKPINDNIPVQPDESEKNEQVTAVENNNENNTNDTDSNNETVPELPPIENKFEGETLESFFADAAFVGDSVMHGLQIYSTWNEAVTNDSTFLTYTSFAARHALADVSENSYHPLYNGERMKVEDALLLSGVDKVFISLGLNDVRVTPTLYVENYVQLLTSIREKCPDIKIFIISTTYPVQSPNPNKMSKSVAVDYRNQLHDLNANLYAWCKDNGAYFVDLMSPIMSESGFLAEEYTSDDYVHLTNKAYSIWDQTLIEYATSLIESGVAPDSFPQVPIYETAETETEPTLSSDTVVTEFDAATPEESTETEIPESEAATPEETTETETPESETTTNNSELSEQTDSEDHTGSQTEASVNE